MYKVFVVVGVFGLLVSLHTLALADSAEQAPLPAQTPIQIPMQAQPQPQARRRTQPEIRRLMPAQQLPDQRLTYVKKLTASTTKKGLRLAGDLQTSNTCMEADFVEGPAGYQAVEFRRPGTERQACGQIVLYRHVSAEFPDMQASDVMVEARGYDLPVR